ncbi:hypothetical protein LEP1GSC038_4305 [Leptospira weilii str. 2006001855]|uniref:Uncharacterized protein n=1 Tax=Leptospira weilii str. 2006001855 TaxID=996804 RepID=M6FL50_9LEPT|nr:hypothetical protein LEP1GSC038_4305 [Leptospira weilii str. 2006001855]
MSKILHLNAGFMLKLTVFYFIGMSNILRTSRKSLRQLLYKIRTKF